MRSQKATPATAKGGKRTNVRARALKRRPNLFPVGTPAEKQAKAAKLAQYIEENRQELEKEVDEVRQRHEREASRLSQEQRNQPHDMPSALPSWPQTKGAWLSWLRDNRDVFDETWRSVKEGARRKYSNRVMADVVNFPREMKVPKMKLEGFPSDVPKLQWAPKLRRGFNLLRLDKVRKVVLVATASRKISAVLLEDGRITSKLALLKRCFEIIGDNHFRFTQT